MSTPTLAPAPAWRDIRKVGPALIVLFGLVLMLTPMASVGVTGSVGNAGVQCKVDCDAPFETGPTVPETDPTVPETDPTVPETDPTVPVGDQLPPTGNDSNVGAIVLGGLFVVGGLGLLVGVRRRPVA